MSGTSPVTTTDPAAALTSWRIYTHGSATGVLSVLVAVDHLHPPELDHGRDVYIYRALGKEVPFPHIASGGSSSNASRRYIAIAVVRENLYRLGKWQAQRCG
jgi:hypothetical protein